ncbi:hypothetical protein ACFE04_019335 [Oxalis oulophora]
MVQSMFIKTTRSPSCFFTSPNSSFEHDKGGFIRNVASLHIQYPGFFTRTQSTRRQTNGLQFTRLDGKIPVRIYSSLGDNLRHTSETTSPDITLQNGHLSESNIDSDLIGTSEKRKSSWWELLNTFYQFSRPHTIIGTVIGITSVSILPIGTNAQLLTPKFFIGLLKALVPSLLMNVYIVGLNQLYDVEIDKINKPYLPVASGEFSMGTGKAIVFTSLVLSLAMGILFQSPPLLTALYIGCLLGSAYSIDYPLLRWKRQPFLAASCILIVRSFVIQLAYFEHMQRYVLGMPFVITKPVIFAVAFMFFFSSVIALFKDIPDVDGDKDFGIQSFSVKLGQERVFWLCVVMLLMAYGASAIVGAFSSSLPCKLITILGHCTLASILWLRAQSIDLKSNASITSFYMFIWKLFYAEYLLIPFVR